MKIWEPDLTLHRTYDNFLSPYDFNVSIAHIYPQINSNFHPGIPDSMIKNPLANIN